MSVIVILVGCALAFILAILVIILRRRGLFCKINISTGKPPLRSAKIAYKFARGPYKNVGKLFEEVCGLAPNNTPIGIYYDDPKKVPADKLRYAVGTVLEEDGQGGCDSNLQEKLQKEGYNIFQLPHAQTVVRVVFPFVDKLSIFVAVWRVYPKLAAYIDEHKLHAHPFMEVYRDGIMHFMVPLKNQEDFYIPEALEYFNGKSPYPENY